MIYRFRGNYNWLSNFYPVKIKLKDIVYPSVENAYQSMKNNNIYWKHYCRDNSPKDVKIKSKTIKIRKNWDNIKIKCMEFCLIQKYQQEPFKTLLKKTKNENILEGNDWGDSFWGVDLTVNPNYGENNLGRLIMDIRKKLYE